MNKLPDISRLRRNDYMHWYRKIIKGGWKSIKDYRKAYNKYINLSSDKKFEYDLSEV